MKSMSAIALMFILALPGLAGAAGPSLFPAMEGWTRPQAPAEYSVDNLYEYIDGAAEVFIGYDFQNLASMTYSASGGASITVDIYRHADRRNGFGIYTQEKPRRGDFLDIGTQGYYEKGILNFFKGRYYVKISAFDLGDRDRDVLLGLARRIAALIPDETGYPAILSVFPVPGRVPGSERFTGRNFLGHKFLKNAYICDYQRDGLTLQPFILEGDSPADRNAMVQAYLDFIRSRGGEVEVREGAARLTDPYYRSRGPLTLRWRGRYAWGVFSTDTEQADRLADTIGSALP